MGNRPTLKLKPEALLDYYVARTPPIVDRLREKINIEELDRVLAEVKRKKESTNVT